MKIAFLIALLGGLIFTPGSQAQTPWMRQHPDVSWQYLKHWEAEHQWLTPAREGRIHFEKHEVGQARPLLEQALAEGAEDGRLLYELGYSCRLEGDDLAALGYLDRATRLLARDDPSHLYHFNSHYLAGLIREERGEDDQALADYTESLRLRPDVAPLRGRKAYLHARKGDAAAARREISELLRLEPDSGPALFLAGDLAREAGEYDAAEQYLKRALKAGMEPAPINYALGYLAGKRDRSGEAREYYESALKADPGHRDALVALANLSYREDDLDRARKYFELLAEREPGRGRWCYNLGVIYRDLGRNDLSEAALAEARRLDPELFTSPAIAADAAQSFHRAGELLKNDQPREAIQLYREALTEDPFFIPAYYNLAIAYRGVGEGRRAFRQYDRLLRIDPDHSSAQLNSGILAVELKDQSAAAFHLRRYLQLVPDSPQADLVHRYLREMRGW